MLFVFRFRRLGVLVCALGLSWAASGSPPDKTNPFSGQPPERLIELWPHASHSARRAIVDALFEDIPRAVPALRTALRAGDVETRRFALAVLGGMRATAAAPDVLAAVDDPAVKVQVRAVLTLRYVGGPECLPRLRAKLATASEARLVKSCLAALGSLGGPEDIPRLRPYLAHPDESVRVNAAVALAMLGCDAGEAVTLAACTSDDPQARKEATCGLGYFHSPAARARVGAILADPRGRWKSYAAIAAARQELAVLPPEARVSRLAALAQDRNPRLAAWAVEELAALDDPDVHSCLARLAASEAPAARTARRFLNVREVRP